MDAKLYCEEVERKAKLNRELVLTTPIVDDGSALVSLKDTGLNLLFEPSFMVGYNYLVRKLVAEKIGRIVKVLEKQNKVLIIRSVWRSFEHQRKIWNNKIAFLEREHPEKSMNELEVLTSNFIAPPTESMHSTGGAIDALIFDNDQIAIMDFGTNKGLDIDLGEKCYPYHPEISDKAKENRTLLIEVFEQEDFVVDLMEYWHFDFGNSMWAIDKKKDCAIYGPKGAL